MFLKRLSALLFLLVGFSFAYKGVGCSDGVNIGNVELKGLRFTKEQVVLRELQLKSGALYSDSLFEADARRLESLDIFSNIELSCEKNGNLQNLTFQFTEIFPLIPAPAGKKTDQDGWMLGAALAYLNLAGEDIRVETQYRTSVSPWFDANEYAVYLSSPWLFGLPLSWNLEFLRTDSYDELRNYQAESWLSDLDLEWHFQKPYALLLALAYRYVEPFGHVPEIGAGFAIDTRDSPLDSRKGIYEEMLITKVGGWLDSPDDYVEYLVDLRGYFTINRFISGASILFRYRPGEVAFFDRFHHGGANSFRGYEADSLRHGESEVILNFEERFVLLERRPVNLGGFHFFYGVQLVAGLDGSILWNDGSPEKENFAGAIYGGIHLLIPALERLRIEVGYSPDTKEAKFFVGLYEKNVSQRWRSR